MYILAALRLREVVGMRVTTLKFNQGAHNATTSRDANIGLVQGPWIGVPELRAPGDLHLKAHLASVVSVLLQSFTVRLSYTRL